MGFDIDNSFFHQNLTGLKVLVLVPHEDDEINTCGAFLKVLTHNGAYVKLVYTTNGDWKYPASVRMKEAKESAALLGVKEDSIIFLGYGDSINNDERNHIYYSSNIPAKSSAGHTETYGTKLFPDYSYLIRGKHQAYTRSNYLEDIIAVLENEKADLIICTDFDEHPDHRMLSLLFDQAIGIVCKRDSNYHPEVWKRFAYSLSYTAIPDYSSINNPETKRPNVGSTDKYSFDIIDKSIYSWKERLRIPVPFSEGENLRNHYLAKALRKHRSQRIITHADRIINSDEVYWKRRTDNLALSASVQTTSGNGAYLNDFLLYNTDDVDSLTPAFSNYYWQPNANDIEKRAEFIWDSPQHLETIVLYSSINTDAGIDELMIELDDGYRCIVKDIGNDGSPCRVELGRHDNIKRCVISIVSFRGTGYGLSECEIYSKSDVCSCIKPYIKIISGDNFIYEYLTDMNEESIDLGIYQYGLHRGEYSFEVVQGKSKIENNCLLINPGDKEILLRCKSGDAWDQIKIKRLSDQEYSSRKKEVIQDGKYLIKERKSYKIHNMLFILAKQGPYAVVRRTYKNVLMPRIRKWTHGTS